MKRTKSIILFIIFTIFILLISEFLTSIYNEDISSKINPDKEIKKVDTIISDKELYNVVRVVDGDTIIISYQNNDEKIRLIGVNTPEVVDPRKKVECFGKEASQFTKDTLKDRKIRLEFDTSQSKRDKYGRILAYVFRDDGLFLNKEIIANGFGYEYTYNIPYKFMFEFKNEQKNAEKNNLGLWKDGACDK